jgi:hypothetical protein
MANQPEGEEKEAAHRPCPHCGASLKASARYCPECGRPVAAPLAAPLPRVDILAWLKSGWHLFAANPMAGVLIPLAMVGPLVVLRLAQRAVMRQLAGFDVAELDQPTLVTLLITWVSLLIYALVAPALAAGVGACFLEGIRSSDLTIHRLGTGFRHWWPSTWVAWLPCLGLWLFSPFVAVPAGFLLFTFAWLAIFRIADTGCGGIKALRFAWEAMRGRAGKMLLFTFVAVVLAWAGLFGDWVVSLIPVRPESGGVGYELMPRIVYVVALITLPVVVGAAAAAYDALSKREEAVAQ